MMKSGRPRIGREVEDDFVMTEVERNLFLRMGWFRPDGVILGRECRPLSLGSFHAVETMGLSLLKRDPGLTPKEELGELCAYVWLHTAPVGEVERALWSGDWRGLVDEFEEENPEATLAVLMEWRSIREDLLGVVEAARVTIRSRPRNGDGGKSKTPPDVTGPTVFDHKVRTLCALLGRPLPEILWELPLAQAEKLYHAEMYWDGQWTVRSKPIDGVEEDDFSEFQVRELSEEVNDTRTRDEHEDEDD